MRKSLELSSPDSCINRAETDEMVFVFLARDPIAPSVIRHWVEERVAAGLNNYDDKQIQNALNSADVMDLQRNNIRKRLGK